MVKGIRSLRFIKEFGVLGFFRGFVFLAVTLIPKP